MHDLTLIYILAGTLAALLLLRAVIPLVDHLSPSKRRGRWILRIFQAFRSFDPTSGPIPKSMKDMLEALREHVTKTNQRINPAIYWLYAMVFMMEDKPWYNSKEVLGVLEELAEKDEPECQFLLGTFLKKGGKGFDTDPVTGEYWIRKAKRNGVPLFLKKK